LTLANLAVYIKDSEINPQHNPQDKSWGLYIREKATPQQVEGLYTKNGFRVEHGMTKPCPQVAGLTKNAIGDSILDFNQKGRYIFNLWRRVFI
jgi:hypothetical protein